MERKNYFELLGLAFDPPEANEKKFQRMFSEAFATWEKRTQDLVNNPNSPEQKAYYAAELALHDDILAVMGEKKTRNGEARALKDKKVAQFEQLLDIMLVGQSGSPEVTGAQVRNVCIKLGLAPKTVEDTYQRKGFEIQKKTTSVNLNDAFLGTVVFNEIEGNLERLRTLNVPKYSWSSKVHDLYELACYFTGGDDGAASSYCRKRTTELYSIMEAGAAQLASDMSGPGHLLADLLHAGSKQVFCDEATRKKYDQSLERAKLKDFFLLLKTAPEDFKKDRFFAESCISHIQKYFPDYNLSLALYNQEVGLARDPYEPVEALIHVSCASCKTPAQFRTREEALHAKCSVCGAALYVDCPHCHKKVPSTADRCSCGFLISEMQFFDEYYNDALFALKEMDLGEARRQLENAKKAYPGHPKLAGLEKQITDESARYQKPLDELQSLMSAGLYEQAQRLISQISTQMPQLRLDAQRKEISDKLAEAKRLMPAASVPPIDAANKYIEVLRVVSDYSPAIEKLGSIRPREPRNLGASVKDTPRLTCTLSWTASGDSGITYKVVRKKDGIPKQPSDGEILSEGISDLEYRDTTLQPGVYYGYAVFAFRYGVYSNPATCEVVNYSELDPTRIQATADDKVCRLSWVLPTNCIGVRILRSVNAIPGEMPGRDCTVIADDVSSNYNDKSVTNDTRYGYRLQCIYQSGSTKRYSRGQTVMLTPEEPPMTLNRVSVNVENRTATVRWETSKSAKQTVLIKQVVGGDPQSVVGKNLSISDINAVFGQGKTLTSVDCTAKTCQFVLPQNTCINFAVIVMTASHGMVTSILQASSVEKCEIDRKETRIDGGRLKIILQDWPKHLERIHYLVATKTDNTVPWATSDDAKRRTMNSVTVQEYRQDGMILVEPIPKADMYVSVIGQYKMPDGSVIYSEASRMRLSNKPKEKITYRLTWESAGFFGSRAKAKGCKLIIQCNAPETPEMKLVYRSDGHIPMRLLDPKVSVLHTVQETDSGFPGGQYVYALPDVIWTRIKSKTDLRLMLPEYAMTEYELSCPDIASLQVP